MHAAAAPALMPPTAPGPFTPAVGTCTRAPCSLQSFILTCEHHGLTTAHPRTGDEMRISTLDPSQKAQITAIACLFLASAFSRLSSLRACKRVRRSDREREAGEVTAGVPRRRQADRHRSPPRRQHERAPPPRTERASESAEAVQELSRDGPAPGEGPSLCTPEPPPRRAVRPTCVPCQYAAMVVAASSQRFWCFSSRRIFRA